MSSVFLTVAGVGLAIVLVLLVLKWRLSRASTSKDLVTEASPENTPSSNAVHVLHRLCPHHNVVQRYELEEKDSLDDHLDVLTRKLADKEGRLLLSKCKIRETQNEIENLHAIDQDVRTRYRDIMESLRSDLQNNEKECKKLQEQIEWVSHRRAELKDEVHRGQLLYGEAAAELANNLAELRGMKAGQREYYHQSVMDKPKSTILSHTTMRSRREPQLPSAACALLGKPSYQSSIESMVFE